MLLVVKGVQQQPRSASGDSVVSQEKCCAQGLAFADIAESREIRSENQLAALITALHRCAQGQLQVTLVGAGL
ncbi:hypothetical protein DBB42_23500 [Pseudomonas plecoglossicida]|uniref:Uncharacterized protein n=1 Tax=Pseudomonas plecoglossicida TaxID=70775 RepID=A0A2R7UEL8_PSEDL|nr:hypothetical protein DBB42_23500 [Pseudomonas plecoglossicida]RFQ00289.1 hypothetical protein D0O09_19240 [Pseudomonas putida]